MYLRLIRVPKYRLDIFAIWHQFEDCRLEIIKLRVGLRIELLVNVVSQIALAVSFNATTSNNS